VCGCCVSANSLCEPGGLAVEGAGNLYVADSSNHRVLEYDTPLTSGTTADRVFGQGGSFTTRFCNRTPASDAVHAERVELRLPVSGGGIR
jgi:hypothetical protein